jgi:hypothetical protein
MAMAAPGRSSISSVGCGGARPSRGAARRATAALKDARMKELVALLMDAHATIRRLEREHGKGIDAIDAEVDERLAATRPWLEAQVRQVRGAATGATYADKLRRDAALHAISCDALTATVADLRRARRGRRLPNRVDTPSTSSTSGEAEQFEEQSVEQSSGSDGEVTPSVLFNIYEERVDVGSMTDALPLVADAAVQTCGDPAGCIGVEAEACWQHGAGEDCARASEALAAFRRASQRWNRLQLDQHWAALDCKAEPLGMDEALDQHMAALDQHMAALDLHMAALEGKAKAETKGKG